MYIHYTIHRKLNIAFVFCEGEFTAQAYFSVMRALAREPDYRRGMLKITDLLSAKEDFHLADMRESLDYIKNLAAQGLALDHTVLLSRNEGIRQLVDTMKLLSHNVPLEFDVFSTLEEAIAALGLSDHRQEILDGYREGKTRLGVGSA